MAGQTRNIGRFSNARLIGRGGFGSVYQATDAEHGREVAIKVLQGSLGETERRRFDRERQTMGRLGSHPNIIPVHESGYTDEGEGFIVMELATGGSLGARLTAGERLSWNEAVAISAAVAGAAQAAHDQGVLHRDIKPDNILIDAYGNPRLTDFGIAAVASNATATTSTTATLAHAAPELLQGQPSTPAVDIYAISSTLYNLITGLPPFQRPGDEGVPAMITRALTQPPPDLTAYNVPPAVALVAERALAKDPADRQATAAQLNAELLAAASDPAGPGHDTATRVAPIVAADTLVERAPLSDPRRPEGPGANPPPNTPNPAHPSNQPPQYPQPPPQDQYGYQGGHPSPHGTGQPYSDQVATVAGISTQTDAGQGFAQPGYGGSGYGGPGTGHYPGSPAGPAPKKGRGVWVAAAVVLAAILGGVGAMALVRSGSGSDNEATGTSTTTTAEPDVVGGGAGSTIASTESSTGSESATIPPASDRTTLSSVASTAKATTTTALPTTTSTTVDVACPTRVLTARTARFDILVCGDGSGNLTYVGRKRADGTGIELPACFAGAGTFVARNLGFTYIIDTVADSLVVFDPDDVIVVDEAISPPAVPAVPESVNLCS